MGTRHLIREIDMSRCVDKVKGIAFAIACLVLHLNGVALDSDTLLALKIHIIEHLSLHLTLIQRVCLLQQTISKCTLTVVDMCDNAKVAYILHLLTM